MSSTAKLSTQAAPQAPTALDAAGVSPTGQLAKSSPSWLWMGLGGGVLIILIGMIAFSEAGGEQPLDCVCPQTILTTSFL
jgi:hypothetical protein